MPTPCSAVIWPLQQHKHGKCFSTTFANSYLGPWSKSFLSESLFLISNKKEEWYLILLMTRTTDTQWRHKSKKSENLGRCDRQNMHQPYLNIWEWELIFSRAVKVISSPGICSPWVRLILVNFHNVFPPKKYILMIDCYC